MAYFCWYDPAQFPIVTCTKLLFFSIGLLETHTWTISQENCPSHGQSHCLMLKMWTQVTEERLNGESTAEPFYAKTACNQGHFLIYKVRQGCHLRYTALYITRNTMGEKSGQTVTIKSLPQQNVGTTNRAFCRYSTHWHRHDIKTGLAMKYNNCVSQWQL